MSVGRNRRKKERANASAPPVDYRATLAELVAIWDEQADAQIVQVLRLDSGHVPVAVRGLAAHAVDCGRATLTLYNAKQPAPAVPVVRTLMEDAIPAHWLLINPEGWKGLMLDGAKNRKTVMAGILNRDPSDDTVTDLLAKASALADEYSAHGSGWLFQQRARAVTGSEEMYLLYRLASNLSHAGVGVVDLYTGGQPDAELQVAIIPYASHGAAAGWLKVATALLLRALLCVGSRRRRPALGAAVDPHR
ncbi:DUF5677 domain-containing protein [Rathayibacter rathayi]|uniref:DUF5677 domain-containing protein n=1 Tax=Rathayibacter rathayi TaxID=33887 RepID=UPI0011B0B7B1|nr:DUF5677 domain-containing protein [Rathayibacter rathayi]